MGKKKKIEIESHACRPPRIQGWHMHVDREWGLTDLNIDVALEGLKVTRSWKFPQGKRHTWLSAEKHNPDDNVYGDVSEIFCGYSRTSAISNKTMSDISKGRSCSTAACKHVSECLRCPTASAAVAAAQKKTPRADWVSRQRERHFCPNTVFAGCSLSWWYLRKRTRCLTEEKCRSRCQQ